MRRLVTCFENVKVGKKLGMGFGLTLLLTVAVAFCGIKNLNDISGRAEKVSQLKIVNDLFAKAKDARLKYIKTHDEKFIADNERLLQKIEGQLASLQHYAWRPEQKSNLDRLNVLLKIYRDKRSETVSETQQRQRIIGNLVIRDEISTIQRLAQSYTQDPATVSVSATLQEIIKHISGIGIRVRLLEMENSADAQQVLTDFIAESIQLIDSVKLEVNASDASTLSGIAASLAGKQHSAMGYHQSYLAEQDATRLLGVAGGELTGLCDQLFEQQLQATHDDISRAIFWMCAILVAAIILSIAVAWVITHQIIKPLSVTLRVAQQIARGDLSANLRTSRRDELGELMHAVGDMNADLRRIIGEIRSGVTQVSQASAEIAAGNNDLSARTEEQAAALEQTAASMEQLTATVRQNVDNIHNTSQLASVTSDTANKGGRTGESGGGNHE